MTRHLTDLDLVGPDGVSRILSLCAPVRDATLADHSVAMVFEKPSARTRNSTEMAVVDLGGHPVMITDAEVGIDRRETAEDVALTLGCFHQVIAARVNDHGVLERMRDALDAHETGVSVVNLLSDHSHPCQGLADALTMRSELAGSLTGRKVAYVGDANNVTISLAQVSLTLGMEIAIASPEGYQLDSAAIEALTRFGASSGATVSQTTEPREAAAGAAVLYTDVWTSMGEEAERDQRLHDLAGYSIGEELVELAEPDVIVMHCLPAHRGEEISAEVLEGPRSRVWIQAANRRVAMRGVLRWVRGVGA
jgi:ornithine carbamoyltransferase